ncbi:hypothetical protein FA10DRAFT_303447 [Acaromyces ingoldii]|uniref:DUF833-domain-containing protein n=1 Tax=Acaromyces ingoldii TaxID=215250 RepID=A0A316YHD4_9BASI|nr:hypothetical protein FA10DRAFT_303447 [Acaromyces ingoldii]PWN88486.1 hypothetical protein FA10DRAFT_303447 [Acaromyces ingoldii]
MCCILLTLSHPDFSLVLASNRDEVVARPTKPSAWHSFDTSISTSEEQGLVLSGVDFSPNGGGTWLGITRSGRLAALTNISYDAQYEVPSSYKSRGALLRRWLLLPESEGNAATEKFVKEVENDADQYPGFNLFYGTTTMKTVAEEGNGHSRAATSLHHACNRDSTGSRGFTVEDLSRDSTSSIALACPPPGDGEGDGTDGKPVSKSCGFSNESGGKSPMWEKVRLGKKLLDEALERFDEAERGAATNGDRKSDGKGVMDEEERLRRQEEILAEDLFTILRTPSDPLPETNEDRKKSILIPPLDLGRGSFFATRTSTVLIVRRNGRGGENPLARWWERDVYQQHDNEDMPSCLPSEEAKKTQRYYDWKLQ